MLCLVSGVAEAQPARAPSTPAVAGSDASVDQLLATRETPLLEALRAAERDADRGALARAGTVADAAQRDATPLGEDTLDPAFAAQLQMPPLPFRMTPRLARALSLYRSNEAARRALTGFLRNSGRYLSRIQAQLVAEGMPAPLAWVVAAESNFDPRAESPVGAMGLWQFIPETARGLGLRVDDWVDERRDPVRATTAGGRYLTELRARFGSWELALAAYNMGYNALLRAIRKYNTNDFETLATLEAGLPWETLHYVPRILGLAVAAHNEAQFALGAVNRETFVAWDDVALTRSVALADLAREAELTEARLRELNPALLRSRTPPADARTPFTLHVPQGSAERVRAALGRVRQDPNRAYALRLGESLDEVAARHQLRPSQLLARSGLVSESGLGVGSLLLVPAATHPTVSASLPVVPLDPAQASAPVPPGATRVYLRLAYGDESPRVARALGMNLDRFVQLNNLDPAARLQSGMWLVAHVTRDLAATVRVYTDAEVEALDRTSDAFADRAVAGDGRVRVRVVVRSGDSFSSIAQRFGTSVGSLERVNQRSRRTTLQAGDVLVVYATPERARQEETVARAEPEPEPERPSTTASNDP
ncbi:MAG: transglycosylase SLT domain-containing protein [Myxococcales bacterium]|nr:transglycosylase SLT domain-containing protein [Myxococcales bacterium]